MSKDFVHNKNSKYIISDDDDDDYSQCPPRLVPYSDHSDSDTVPEETINKKERRKRSQVQKTNWKENINKKNRENGKRYLGRKKISSNWTNVVKNERRLKPRCHCIRQKNNGTLKCSLFSEEDREEIFILFWKLTWQEKKIYIDGLVNVSSTQRHRDRKEEFISRRKNSMLYHLRKNDKNHRVCKTMFLNTLNLGKFCVFKWKNSLISQENVFKTTIKTNRYQYQVDSLKDFLSNLPKMESHYCRKRTQKKYLLPEWSSKKALYNFYVSDWCRAHDVAPVSTAKFYNTLDIENISLYRPKKDQCEICTAYKSNQLLESKYKAHVDRKKEARAEKNRDKTEEEFVFTMDLQAVLLVPKSNVSSLYYRTKLCVHNFCLYNLKNHKGYCYLWNENEAGLTGDVFASIVVTFITQHVLPSMGENKNAKIILYSDGCTAQNRNAVMTNALLNLAMLKKITIIQKYLEVGHTQMEADSIHACIERKIKNKIINVPAEYYNICKNARTNPEPYDVTYLNHSFFKSFKNVEFFRSIRPGKKKGDPKVSINSEKLS